MQSIFRVTFDRFRKPRDCRYFSPGYGFRNEDKDEDFADGHPAIPKYQKFFNTRL